MSKKCDHIFCCLVVPGSKRSTADFHTVEQEAGRAVLKLLDAKIGNTVNESLAVYRALASHAVNVGLTQSDAFLPSHAEKSISHA